MCKQQMVRWDFSSGFACNYYYSLQLLLKMWRYFGTSHLLRSLLLWLLSLSPHHTPSSPYDPTTKGLKPGKMGATRTLALALRPAGIHTHSLASILYQLLRILNTILVCPHFTDEESQPLECLIICLKSPSSQMVKPGLEVKSPGIKPHVFFP